jgi:hypothetical protein
VRGALRQVRAHLGLRGTFLLILGVGKTSYGIGFIVEPPADPAPGLALLTHLCPLTSWAWLWITAGVVTLAAAFLQVGRDWAGFVAAIIPPLVWATAYTAAVLDGSYPRGGIVAIWYLTSHVGVIMWAAGVPEHSVPPPPRRARKGVGR